MSASATVESYLEQFDGEARHRLEQLRELTHAEVPDAQEGLAYGLMAYKLRGKPLVYFGGFSRHTGVYATPNAHAAFRADFAPYKQGKGSVQFPLDRPLPMHLIARVIRWRAEAIMQG